MAGEESTQSTHRYSKPWKDSDIVLVLQDDDLTTEDFHCHSTILTLNSPVFERMFNNENFVEGREKKATLTRKEREAFILFLDLMYPPTQTTRPILGKRKAPSEDVQERPHASKKFRFGKEDSNPDSQASSEKESKGVLELYSTVLEYANEYLVECVGLRVDQLLSLEVHSRITAYAEPKKDIKTCLEVLLVADTYKLNRLKAACLSYIWTSDDNLLYEDTCVKKLSDETQCILMKLEINKLGILEKRDKRVGRERNTPLHIEVSDVAQRNLIYLSEYKDSDFFYNNPENLSNLSVFESDEWS